MCTKCLHTGVKLISVIVCSSCSIAHGGSFQHSGTSYCAHFVKDNNIHVVALISETMLHALFCVCNVLFHCFIERVSLYGYYNIPPSLYDFVWVSAIQLIRILSYALVATIPFPG